MSSWVPDWAAVPAPLTQFFAERHLATLTTLRADGTPHVVPVGVTLDVPQQCAWVITFAEALKVRHVRERGAVAICQVEGGRWLTLEGTAVATQEPAVVARAVELYTRRYRPPRENPERVALRVEISRVLGSASLLQ